MTQMQDDQERKEIRDIHNGVSRVIGEQVQVKLDLSEAANHVSVPMMSIIAGVVACLMGLAAWGIALQSGKADRSEITEIRSSLTSIMEKKADKDDLSDIKVGVRTLINMHLKGEK